MTRFLRRRALVELSCACPQPGTPAADETVKHQFIPMTYRVGRKQPLRAGCGTCGVKLRITTTRRTP